MRAVEPRDSGHLKIRGFTIFYEDFGDSAAPPMLLLPTWQIAPSLHWKMQVPFLARSRRVVTFDPPGIGGGERTTDPRAFKVDRVVRYAVGAARSSRHCERRRRSGSRSAEHTGSGWLARFRSASTRPSSSPSSSRVAHGQIPPFGRSATRTRAGRSATRTTGARISRLAEFFFERRLPSPTRPSWSTISSPGEWRRPQRSSKSRS